MTSSVSFDFIFFNNILEYNRNNSNLNVIEIGGLDLETLTFYFQPKEDFRKTKVETKGQTIYIFF